jgi:hypothetical protein
MRSHLGCHASSRFLQTRSSLVQNFDADIAFAEFEAARLLRPKNCPGNLARAPDVGIQVIWGYLTQARWNKWLPTGARRKKDTPTLHFCAGKWLDAEPSQDRRGANKSGRKTSGTLKLLGRCTDKPIGWLAARRHVVEAHIRWQKRLAELELAALQRLEETSQHGNAFATRAPFPRNAGERRQASARRRARTR